MAGLAEFGWSSLWTMFFYVALIVPFWGMLYGKVFGTSYGMNFPWWTAIAGTSHVHWVFGWWEWMIVVLFMTAQCLADEALVGDQARPTLKGLVSFFAIVVIGYLHRHGLRQICAPLAA